MSQRDGAASVNRTRGSGGLASPGMGRPPRDQPVPGFVHVTSRGVRRQPIFVDDHDRRAFMAFLAQASYRRDWVCLAYCLMTNHYHLVLSLRERTLSRGMHRLNGVFARRFNARHGHVRSSVRGAVHGSSHRVRDAPSRGPAVRRAQPRPRGHLLGSGGLAVEQLPCDSWARPVSSLSGGAASPVDVRARHARRRALRGVRARRRAHSCLGLRRAEGTCPAEACPRAWHGFRLRLERGHEAVEVVVARPPAARDAYQPATRQLAHVHARGMEPLDDLRRLLLRPERDQRRRDGGGDDLHPRLEEGAAARRRTRRAPGRGVNVPSGSWAVCAK